MFRKVRNLIATTSLTMRRYKNWKRDDDPRYRSIRRRKTTWEWFQQTMDNMRTAMEDVTEANNQLRSSWLDLLDSWHDLRKEKRFSFENLSPESDNEPKFATIVESGSSSDSGVVELRHESVIDEITREEWEQEQPEEESETSIK